MDTYFINTVCLQRHLIVQFSLKNYKTYTKTDKRKPIWRSKDRKVIQPFKTHGIRSVQKLGNGNYDKFDAGTQQETYIKNGNSDKIYAGT